MYEKSGDCHFQASCVASEQIFCRGYTRAAYSLATCLSPIQIPRRNQIELLQATCGKELLSRATAHVLFSVLVLWPKCMLSGDTPCPNFWHSAPQVFMFLIQIVMRCSPKLMFRAPSFDAPRPNFSYFRTQIAMFRVPPLMFSAPIFDAPRPTFLCFTTQIAMFRVFPLMSSAPCFDAPRPNFSCFTTQIAMLRAPTFYGPCPKYSGATTQSFAVAP